MNGFIVIGPNGKIATEGFEEFPGESCREVSIEVMRWGIDRLNAAIEAASTPPYRNQTCCEGIGHDAMANLRRDRWFYGSSN